MSKTGLSALAIFIGASATTPASAIDVRLLGNIGSSCILSLTTAGRLAPSSDGAVLGSEQPNGAAAVMLVVAIGAKPTLAVGAPTLSTPAGYSGNTSPEIRYDSLLGATVGFTSANSSIALGGLLDTVTVNGRLQNSTGFAAGNYEIKSVVTCQQ